MALIIEAPNEIYSIQNSKNIKLFLAGGITNCPDWQNEIIEAIKSRNILTIYNPRRKVFPIDDANLSDQQISWEFEHLYKSDIISFWFSKGSLNPIVLFELGKYGLSPIGKTKTILIGIDPEYQRKEDVEIQTKLENSHIKIVYSLNDLASQILKATD